MGFGTLLLTRPAARSRSWKVELPLYSSVLMVLLILLAVATLPLRDCPAVSWDFDWCDHHVVHYAEVLAAARGINDVPRIRS